MNIYSTQLRVKPFITAPVGESQQTFLITHRDFSQNWESFATRAHAYTLTIQPQLPVICQIYRWRRHVLMSTTLDTSTAELASNRPGTSICLGALAHTAAFQSRDLPQRIFRTFGRFVTEVIREPFDILGLEDWLLQIQSNLNQPMSPTTGSRLIQLFEEEFGILGRRNVVGTVYGSGRAIAFLWNTVETATARDLPSADLYWQTVGTRGKALPALRATRSFRLSLLPLVPVLLSTMMLLVASGLSTMHFGVGGLVSQTALLLVSGVVLSVALQSNRSWQQRLLALPAVDEFAMKICTVVTALLFGLHLLVCTLSILSE